MRLLALLMAASLSAGCGANLESQYQARSAETKLGTAASRDAERCRSLTAQHRGWGFTSASFAVLAGGSGLATIPVSDEAGQTGLAIGAAAAAAIAAGAKFVSDSAASSWARECSQ